jgi:hypothetical protein
MMVQFLLHGLIGVERTMARRMYDSRVGVGRYIGPKPSDKFDWDDAIHRLRRMLDKMYGDDK